MFLHQIDSFDFLSRSLNPCQPEYLESNNFSQSFPLLWKRYYLHLTSKTILNKEISLTPKLSSSLEQQIFSHPTQDIFFLPSSHPHKNLLWKLTNFLEIPSRILKDIKKSGREMSIELIKHILPAKERCLYFQDASSLTNLAKIGSQVSNFLGFTPIGIPKYTNGMVKILQFKYFENLSTHSLGTPIPPKSTFVEIYVQAGYKFKASHHTL